MLILPNFFVVGAAKCGTTSLYELLRPHPEIFLPEAKEPQFFSNDEHFARGLEHYARTHFGGCTAPVRGDCTPHYLAWEKAARRIHELIPPEGHRFIAILRDPVERAHSLYWNMVYEGHEPLSFADALDAETARAQDPELGRLGSLRFLYASSSLYGRQLAAWLRLFPRERFLVLRLDELQRDPAAVVRRICRFLGVSEDYEPPPMAPANPAGVTRSAAMHRFLRHPHWLKEPFKAVLPHAARQRLLKTLFALNKRARPYQPLPSELERRLREQFAPDLDLLAELTGLAVADWLPRAPEAAATERRP